MAKRPSSRAASLVRILATTPTLEEQLGAKDRTPFVSVSEFATSPDYFNFPDFWPSTLDELEKATAQGVRGYILEAGQGGGKSFFSFVLLGYLLYRIAYREVVLGEDVRGPLDLASNTVITVANVAIRAKTAKDIIFEKLRVAIQKSPWFREYLPLDENVKSEVRFTGRDYLIFPGNSEIDSVLGFDLIAAVVDEANFFEDTSSKGGTDYVARMFKELFGRVTSRYGKLGYVGVISSRNTMADFTARKRIEIERDPEMARIFYLPPTRTSWSYWPTRREQRQKWKTFDAEELRFVDDAIDVAHRTPTEDPMRIWVPEEFWPVFTTDPEGSLRDHASIPGQAIDPYIRRVSAIRPDFDMPNPILDGVTAKDWGDPRVDFSDLVSDDFYGDPEYTYHFHADLALGKGSGDAVGFAFAYNAGTDQSLLVEEQRRPEKAILIEVPFAIAIRAAMGGEIEFAHLRKLIYWLKDVRGFRFRKSSYDGWQSIDSVQTLNRAGFDVETFSLDRTLTGYATLKEALYEGRVFFPAARGQTKASNAQDLAILAAKGDPWAILQTELRQLNLVNGKKVDHPIKGSKDVADAVAGAVTQVMHFYAAPNVDKLK